MNSCVRDGVVEKLTNCSKRLFLELNLVPRAFPPPKPREMPWGLGTRLSLTVTESISAIISVVNSSGFFYHFIKV